MIERLKITSDEIDKFLNEVKEMLTNCKKIADIKLDTKNIIKELDNNIIKPTIYITSDIYNKMFALVHESTVECSWHGLVKRKKDTQEYMIYDILMFPQINSPTATQTEEEAFAEWQTKLIMDPDFPIEDLRLHGHSHVNMNVYSSGVDDNYQKDLITKVEDEDYYIFLVLNKKHEICPLVYDYHQHVLFTNDDVRIILIDKNGENITEWAKNQIDKYCTIQRSSYTKRMAGYYPNRQTQFQIENDDYIGIYMGKENITPSKGPKKGKKKNGSK